MSYNNFILSMNRFLFTLLSWIDKWNCLIIFLN